MYEGVEPNQLTGIKNTTPNHGTIHIGYHQNGNNFCEKNTLPDEHL